MRDNYRSVTDICLYSDVVSQLRQFFLQKNFVEVPTQSRLSILAACEDPSTVSVYEFGGERWPLPQTGQMWLEFELLTNPAVAGVFCLSTSYRGEPNPVLGRHDLIFPMFEFESKGTMADLMKLEAGLCEFLGFGEANNFQHKQYDDLARVYGVKELEHEHEKKMLEDYGRVVFLENFPQFTSPFWNMKKNGDHAYKVDVIIDGIETIGSAERSVNSNEMREKFHTISDGGYAKLLYNQFGKERVEKELESYLSLDFFPRFGAGVGVTRLMRAVANNVIK